MAKLISPNHWRYDVTGKPGQEFLEKIDIFYDSNMLIDVCTSFLGLSSSASQLGMVKHIKFDHILDMIFLLVLDRIRTMCKAFNMTLAPNIDFWTHEKITSEAFFSLCNHQN